AARCAKQLTAPRFVMAPDLFEGNPPGVELSYVLAPDNYIPGDATTRARGLAGARPVQPVPRGRPLTLPATLPAPGPSVAVGYGPEVEGGRRGRKRSAPVLTQQVGDFRVAPAGSGGAFCEEDIGGPLLSLDQNRQPFLGGIALFASGWGSGHCASL